MKYFLTAIVSLMLSSSLVQASQPPGPPRNLRIVNGFAGLSYELVTQISQLCHQYQLSSIQGEVLALLHISYAKALDSDFETMMLWNELNELLYSNVLALVATSQTRTDVSEIDSGLSLPERELMALVLDAEKQDVRALNLVLKQILNLEKYKVSFFYNLK